MKTTKETITSRERYGSWSEIDGTFQGEQMIARGEWCDYKMTAFIPKNQEDAKYVVFVQGGAKAFYACGDTLEDAIVVAEKWIMSKTGGYSIEDKINLNNDDRYNLSKEGIYV